MCHEFMDKHAVEIIQHESFMQLSSTALIELISRDSFYAPEIDIFSAVTSWVVANPGVNAEEVLGRDFQDFLGLFWLILLFCKGKIQLSSLLISHLRF